ncbi:methyl-accepting chemotaxis protein [Curvibacter sp. HBC61]|uniref:Methyl-accepting chemotaxis protein n=1 Tax=Curvibacter cyanobacteriorum TaxID=3026422 RepID=A0ABT5N434_9BURK|nr:methyl-accepting chemotaxis protein [Curvibacter sp. HBC61]MDD0840890.1 methyl-accepting chemotaxis protein [Curvibacter sp. HBC61]
MNFIQNFSIRLRLGVGYAALTLALVLVAVLGLQGEARTQANLDHQINDLNVLTRLENELLTAANARAVSARNLVLASSPEDRASETRLVQQAHDKVQSVLAKLGPFVQAMPDTTEALRQSHEQVLKIEAQYGPVALDIVRLAGAGQAEQAIRKINVECRPLLAQLIEQINVSLAESARIGAVASEASHAEFVHLRRVLVSISTGVLLLAIFLSVLTTKSITRPLDQADQAVTSFAEGNLSRSLPARGRNEITHVMHAIEHMRQSLMGIVSDVRRGASQVSGASQEIAEGNQDLSARTEQQASALQQTTASMEMLSGIVQKNSANARHANQLAVQAAAVAQQGGQVVAGVVQTMNSINDSSSRIQEIIGVIDGIAFQTNILALNAAVEAARAGEEGRGFAVVAGEVRVLAQRSATAAKEIKQLISESVERVAQGSTMVAQAGSTMDDIVGSIEKVVTIVAEISEASAEQSASVGQIGEAVALIDQATQQNASLVQEIATAASSLQAQAGELVQAVSVFKLDPEATLRESGAPGWPRLAMG